MAAPKRVLVVLSIAFSIATVAGSACGEKRTTTTNVVGADPVHVALAPGQPIKIATMIESAFLADNVRAVELAAELRGPIAGHPVVVVNTGHGCGGFNGGAAGAAAVLAEGDILGVIGTTCSGAAPGAELGLCDADIPLISPSNTAPFLTDPATHERCYFRTSFSDLVQGQRMADYARTVLNVTRAATIHDDSEYSTSLAQAFADAFADGTHVVFQRLVTPASETDTAVIAAAEGAALDDIIATDPNLQFLFFPVVDLVPAIIVNQARSRSSYNSVQLAGSDGGLTDDFLTAAGAAALSPSAVVMSGPALSFSGAANAQFVADFTAKFGSAPTDPFTQHAFDAANVLLDAIGLVAVDQGGRLVISRQAVISGIYATSDFAGVTGTLTCDSNGELNPDPPVRVFKVASKSPSGTEFVEVFP